MIEEIIICSLICAQISFLLKDSLILDKLVIKITNLLKRQVVIGKQPAALLSSIVLYWISCVFCLSLVISIISAILYNKIYLLSCPILSVIAYRTAFEKNG